MKINLKNAVSAFYPNPSLEQVYFEAVTNAFDAGASEIEIVIKIQSFDRPDTLRIDIRDNGEGFTGQNFNKFSSLMEAANRGHRGLGRLVYLAYFNTVSIESNSVDGARVFIFDDAFSGLSEVEEATGGDSFTSMSFTGYKKERIAAYAYLTPSRLKQSLIKHFFPTLFQKKEKGDVFSIKITSDVQIPNDEYDFRSEVVSIVPDDLPELEMASFNEVDIDLLQTIDVYYSVQKDSEQPKSIATTICVDDRTIDYDLVPLESIPEGYQVTFILMSDYFHGKTDSARTKLILPPEVSERAFRGSIRRILGQILQTSIPEVVKKNKEIGSYLNEHYPHLVGYFPTQVAGVIVKPQHVAEAQNRFFEDQKKILECEELSADQYEKALEMSSRVLMEYVLYRARIIERLRNCDLAKSESDIHNIIVPRRRVFRQGGDLTDIYQNNIWMLDDKYMSYNTVLSDKTMCDVISEITLDEEERDDKKPDITIVFSGDPEISEKVSVVIVELKKEGIALAKKEEVISQLRQRARKLLKYYPEKIERIWFYGITEIDSEFRISMKEDSFKQLFSHGEMFFKTQDIYVEEEGPAFAVDLYIMTYKSLIEDAVARNSAFLNVLKQSISSMKGKLLSGASDGADASDSPSVAAEDSEAAGA